MDRQTEVVSVFTAGPGGGNPAPIIVDAAGMSDPEMQAVAWDSGYESGFILPGAEGCDFALRYWVPNHEMSMCGHVTVGAVWLLDQLGRLPRDRLWISTQSGPVEARVLGRDAQGAVVEVSQPAGIVEPLPDPAQDRDAILAVLGITGAALADLPIQNASTSRVKTLIPLKSVALLDGLRPDFTRMEALCERIGSTGLYPYAVVDPAGQVFAARQFPKSSGYPEDAATGIAAAALAFGLRANGLVAFSEQPIRIRQGFAMGRPSEIAVRFRIEDDRVTGCWIGGAVRRSVAEGRA